MAEKYKHLYEQMKKMVEMYQDEIVPALRQSIAELEQELVEKDNWIRRMDDDRR